MEKLTIKELAPYLPYGLLGKVVDYENNECFIDSVEHICLRDKILTFKDAPDFYFDCPEEVSFKPILRPLSDLTKEIKIKGGAEIIPVRVLWHISDERLTLRGEVEGFSGDYIYGDYQKLFEWHFDVFGLIEKGLAIDLNTI